MLTEIASEDGEGYDLRKGGLKTFLYLFLLVISIIFVNYIFGWESVEEIPTSLQPYSWLLLWINPYLVYIQSALILFFGYLAVRVISGLAYMYFINLTDNPTASAIRSITRISGIAVLLSLLASLFNVNPAAALTVGSFGGLVVGFATQTILSHVIAGVFLLISRPFVYGDLITVSGHTGVVKEIKLMHLVIENADKSENILIPSGSVVTQIIKKKINSKKRSREEVYLTLKHPPRDVSKGSEIQFKGRLVECETRNPVTGAKIKIFESDIGRDDQLVTGKTSDEGIYNIVWTARRVDWGDAKIEVYAKFEGNSHYRESQSEKLSITIGS